MYKHKPFFLKGTFLVLFLTALAVGVLSIATYTSGHERVSSFPFKVGTIMPIFATCDALGANAVAKANLLAGSFKDGNDEFLRQVKAEPAHCFYLQVPMRLRAEEIVYAGMASDGLHVYLIKFEGEDLYGVLALRHRPKPEPAGFAI